MPTALFFGSASAALPGLLLGRFLLLAFFFLAFLLLGLFFIQLLLFLWGTNCTRCASASTALGGTNRTRMLTASSALPALLGIRRRQSGPGQKSGEAQSCKKFFQLLLVHSAPPLFLGSRGFQPRQKRSGKTYFLLRPHSGLPGTPPFQKPPVLAGRSVTGSLDTALTCVYPLRYQEACRPCGD